MRVFTRSRIIFSISLAASAFLFFVLYRVPTQLKLQKEVVAIAHPAHDFTLVAKVPSNRLLPDTVQPIHVEMLGRSGTPAPDGLRVCVEMPGTASACQDWPKQNKVLRTSMDIDVCPSIGVLSQMITLTVRATSWPRTSKPAEQFDLSILRLGPMHVETFSVTTDRHLRTLTRLRGILKDLTLPILIPLVGFLFARESSRRAEKEEVRKILLTKVQGLTKKFYLHLAYHARYAINSLQDGAGQEGTYHLLCLLLVNSRLKDQEGGVFFRNGSAEEIYRDGISLIVDEVRTQLGGETAFRAVLDKMVTLSDPSGKKPPRLVEYLAHPPTATLVQSRNFLLEALNLLQAVTAYELDAPLYEHWYEEPGRVRFETAASKLHFPGQHDRSSMSPRREKAWLSLLGQTRLWLKHKPGSDEYLKKLQKV